MERINSALLIITNPTFLSSPVPFFHQVKSHNYKLFLPQKFSRSLPSTGYLSPIFLIPASPTTWNPHLPWEGSSQGSRVTLNLSNLRHVSQLLHLISLCQRPTCLLWGQARKADCVVLFTYFSILGLNRNAIYITYIYTCKLHVTNDADANTVNMIWELEYHNILEAICCSTSLLCLKPLAKRVCAGICWELGDYEGHVCLLEWLLEVLLGATLCYMGKA